ncbi:TetR/AcrR family transcriptional regulator [Pseudomaricurvus sp. HS19]|uniref:TetR/AcrR family transcriptional regulator n=1 Tax=Pseudomaricurvus sp. HS19 TaxID=2692626 RepID=UPI00136BCA88|nr:TetR/AcrR family transcriptional regulator [Pseudomaricurvus sp. HS19]MYM63345.1 TetR family transcriptional regulator [Pseudomaricurvus sp. HS19]
MMVAEPKATRKRVDPRLRRALIMEEAVSLIGECGYNGFNLHDLARRCGLSNGGVLYHFPSKEHLFLAMLESLHQQQEAHLQPLVDQLQSELATGGVSRSTLRQLLRGIAVAGQDRPAVAQVFLTLKVESSHPGHPAYDYFQRVDRQTRDLLLSACSGLVAEPLRLARQLQAVLDGLLVVWLREEKGFDFVAEVDAALETLLPGG